MDILSLIPLSEVRAIRGGAKSTTYRDVHQGLLSTPIRTAANSSRWVYGEVRKVNLARIAGRSDDEIRALVTTMIAARSSQGYVALLEAADSPMRAPREVAA